MRAAVSYVNQRLGTAILVGREDVITRERRAAPASTSTSPASRSSMRGCRAATRVYADYLYARLQRKGYLFRDCQRLINTDRNHFAACMVALGDADAHGHRRHPQLFDRARRRPPRHRRQARPPRHRRLDRALPRPHRARRRHRRPRHAERRASSPTSPRRPPASPAAWATSRASPCSPIRPSAIPPGERSERVREAVQDPRQAPRRFRV